MDRKWTANGPQMDRNDDKIVPNQSIVERNYKKLLTSSYSNFL